MRPPLIEFLGRHEVTQKRAAAEADLPIQTMNEIANGKRQARTATVNKILAWARRYEPSITYEQLFAPDLAGCGKVA